MTPGRTRNFMGQDGFFWFFGIVEDRNDPSKQGLVRVRCFGLHPDDKTQVPTDHLPWAEVAAPVTDPRSPHRLLEGDLVMGYFKDGQEQQEPIVLNVIQSQGGGNKNSQRGFADPGTNVSDRPSKPKGFTSSGMQPGSPVNYSAGAYTFNINSYAMGVGGLADAAKDALRASQVSLPGGGTVQEPANAANRKSPYVYAHESESGHVIELDDSPGAERVLVFHRAGSSVEMNPDGTVIYRNAKDGWMITLGDDVKYVKGAMKVSNEGEFQHLSGAYTLEIKNGDMKVDVKSGNLNLTVNGNVTETVNGDVTRKISGNETHQVGGNFTVVAATINLN